MATVAFNYHIGVDEQYYSVPFEYIKRKVDVRLTRAVVEIFFDGTRICSHIRLHGRRGQYSTQESHMPPNHQQYIQWNGERFRKWAAKIGENTATAVASTLDGCKVEQQGYRACMALLKLSDQYTPARLEAACQKALSYTIEKLHEMKLSVMTNPFGINWRTTSLPISVLRTDSPCWWTPSGRPVKTIG